MVNHEIISSKDNKTIKDLRKLHTRKQRRKSGRFLIEGEHLIEEAVRYHQQIHFIILSEGVELSFSVEDFECLYVTDNVMKTLSQLDTPPGCIAVAGYIPPEGRNSRVLALDSIQDPGNLGTLIRSADAFGFDKIILSDDTVDPFSDKVLRSAQGSTFHLNIQFKDILNEIKQFDGLTIGTSLEGATDIEEVESTEELLIVLGNEGHGVTEELLDAVDKKVKIEMTGLSESLNVAIAGSIIMHHFKA